ncbi:MAG TPA: hypothetical protein VN654_22620 [Vicinamibacterales bacterium]|nr:hypothetical protein [Vicinamibacterales bacterium]
MAAAAWIGGCGSTSPVPSPSPLRPSADYPSLVGDFGRWATKGSTVVVRYRDSGASFEYACETRLNIQTQNGGTFGGFAEVQGANTNSDRQCDYFAAFTAEMSSDGAIKSFAPDRTYRTIDCTSVSNPTISGTAGRTSIRIVLTDRATCKDPVGQPHDADRTLTMSVIER